MAKPLIPPALRDDSLSFHGTVTTVPGAGSFTSENLAGVKEDGAFIGWYVYVAWDAGGAGAAPQGESQIITGYTSLTGAVMHLPFTAALIATDKVLLINPEIAGADGGGGLYGGQEIWESFEYVSDAALQSRWIEGGDAGNPTRSATSYWGQYAMQTIIGAGVGHVYRQLATRNMNPIANITIAARSDNAGDTFQFTLYDSAGNYSYWTQTIAVADTWDGNDFEIGIHTVPTGSSATPVDLEDVVEIRMAELVAGSTYLFDLITFEGLATEGLEDILEKVNQIFDLENAELITTETGGSVSTSGAAEVDVYINNAPAGVYKPIILKIWFNNQTAGETVVIQEKYRIELGGGWIESDSVEFAGVQDPLLKPIRLDATRFGVQVTIAKTLGADRAYRWEVVHDI